MKLYFLGTVLCIVLLQCRANPIITITADHEDSSLPPQTKIEKEGQVQEETQGVFNSEESKQVDESKPLVDETKSDELEKIENGEETKEEASKSEENALSDPKRKDRKIKVNFVQSHGKICFDFNNNFCVVDKGKAVGRR